MSKASQYQAKVDILTANISSGEQLSDAVSLSGCTPVAFQTDVAVTGTNYTFLGSIDGGVSFNKLRNNIGNDITFSNIAADGIYPLDPAQFVGLDYVKINTSSNESADRTIKLKVHPL